MTSKKTETKPKVQSKLSFYDRLFTKPAPKVADKPKETNDTNKNTSQNDVNNKNLIIFPEVTSDMEVDTTVTQ